MADLNEIVTLKIAGQAFTGWTEISVSRGLNALCSAFSLTVVDTAPGQTDRSAITDQAACQLWIGADLVITGYIDHIDGDIAGDTLTVTGRDKTADLVDCSAVHPTGSWVNAGLATIAGDLIKPFALALKIESPTGARFANFCLEPGEAVAEALFRLTQMRGLMLTTSAAGELVIFSPSSSRPKIPGFEVGRNIKGGRLSSSSAERFSTYLVRGQHRGGDLVSAKDATRPKGQAADVGVLRYRPLVIVSHEQATPAGLESRARFEATSRLGKAQSAEITVAGWRDDAGGLLVPNVIARLNSAARGFDDDMMIADVQLKLDGNGTTAGLRMVRPQAYTTEAILEPKVKHKKKRGGYNIEALRD